MSKFFAALALAVIVAIGVSFSASANGVRKHQAVQPQYAVQQPAPLQRIPIVGTVVYGGLNYAGELILSPTELITGPPRR